MFVYNLSTESASNLVEGQYGSMSSKLIYGVFNTPTNSIPGSAVCAFALQVSAQLRLNILPSFTVLSAQRVVLKLLFNFVICRTLPTHLRDSSRSRAASTPTGCQ